MPASPKAERPPRLRVLARALAQRLLDRCETTFWSSGRRPLPHPPIFIVGAPRSGSTLLYQVLTDRYDVGYISNAHCRWHGGPSFVERLRRPLRARGQSDYESDYGATRRPSDPSECGDYWYRFFPRTPHFVTLEATPDRQLRRLRAAMRALTAAFARPVVIKNLYCTLRLGPIAAALPEALFVVIRRDLVENAQSLLVGRRRNHGDYGAWWSAEPPDVSDLRQLPVHEQVVEQVRSIERQLDADAAAIGAIRFHEVDYWRLCREPAGVLQDFERFLAGHGIALPLRGEVPASFEPGGKVSVPADLYEQLRAHAQRGRVTSDA